MEGQDAQKDFGTFDETIIFPKVGQNLIRLTSLAATIEWVKQNNLGSVSSIMPIFRTGEMNVIIPQISNGGLVITIGQLKKESPAQLKQLVHQELGGRES